MNFYVNELLLLYTDSLYASAVYYSVQYSTVVLYTSVLQLIFMYTCSVNAARKGSNYLEMYYFAR